jgi:hypothetical protein
MYRLRLRPWMGVAVAALVLGSAGAAYAVTSTQTKTISACAHHRGGVLYLAHRCKRHDRRLKWNVAGPRGPRGPRGLRGATGARGAAGAVGPTFGVVSGGDDPLALTSASITIYSIRITTSTPGHLWVQAHFGSGPFSCRASCRVSYGLYVDGAPITGGRRDYDGSAGKNPAGSPSESWGISGPLPAGTHTVSLEVTPSSGVSSMGSSAVTPEVGTILLGSG